MPWKSALSGALVSCVLLAAICTARDQPTSNPAVDAIFADLTKRGSPGCAVGIYRDGKNVYARGYGLSNNEENVPITAETVFDVCSLSKQITAANILLLEKQGKLRRHDDVRK